MIYSKLFLVPLLACALMTSGAAQDVWPPAEATVQTPSSLTFDMTRALCEASPEGDCFPTNGCKAWQNGKNTEDNVPPDQANTAFIELGPCAYREAHWHSATEVIQLIGGPEVVKSVTWGPDGGPPNKLIISDIKLVPDDSASGGDGQAVVYPAGWPHFQFNPSCDKTALLGLGFDKAKIDTISMPGANDAFSRDEALDYNDFAYKIPEGATGMPESSYIWSINQKCADYCGLDCYVPEGAAPNEYVCEQRDPHHHHHDGPREYRPRSRADRMEG